MLSVTQVMSGVECGEDPDHGLVPSHHVRSPQRAWRGVVAQRADAIERAAVTLDYQVLSRPVAIRTAGAVTGNRAVHQSGVDRLQLLVADTQPVRGAVTEILDENVAVAHHVVN